MCLACILILKEEERLPALMQIATGIPYNDVTAASLQTRGNTAITTSGPIISPAARRPRKASQITFYKYISINIYMTTDVDGLIINRLSSKNLNVVCFRRLCLHSPAHSITTPTVRFTSHSDCRIHIGTSFSLTSNTSMLPDNLIQPDFLILLKSGCFLQRVWVSLYVFEARIERQVNL